MKYRPDIDGLRAIAVSSVVFFHAGAWPFRSGYVGVDIFFVISGFLIGGVIFQEVSGGHFSFAYFYLRRAKRILPALFFVLLVSLAIGLILLAPSELERFASSAVFVLAACSNVFFWWHSNYFSPDAHLDPMLMTWSLGVEEQFYLVFPFVIIFLCKFGNKAVLRGLTILCSSSFVLSVFLTLKAPSAAFYLIPTRAWELGAGALLAIAQQTRTSEPPPPLLRQIVSILGLIVLLTSVLVFDEKTAFPGMAALLPVLGTVALIYSQGSFINSYLLSHPILVAIGLISYSWYLWHWPLMAFVTASTVERPAVSVLLGVALLSFLLAGLSWRFIEQPFRKGALSRKGLVRNLSTVAVILVVLCLATKGTGGFPQRVPFPVRQIEIANGAARGSSCLAAFGVSEPNLVQQCYSTGDQPSVAVIGDSHAGALGPGVRQLAKANGWGFAILTKASCRPLMGVTVWRRDRPTLASDCHNFMSAAFSLVERDPSIKSVILAGLWDGPVNNSDEERYCEAASACPRGSQLALLDQGLSRTIQRLIELGKRVYIAEDVPYWAFDPVRITFIQNMGARSGVQSLLEGERGQERISLLRTRNKSVDRTVAQAAAAHGADLLDLPSSFCRAAKCSFWEGQNLLYTDRSHLSETGAIHALTPWARLIFERPRAPSDASIPGSSEQ